MYIYQTYTNAEIGWGLCSDTHLQIKYQYLVIIRQASNCSLIRKCLKNSWETSIKWSFLMFPLLEFSISKFKSISMIRTLTVYFPYLTMMETVWYLEEICTSQWVHTLLIPVSNLNSLEYTWLKIICWLIPWIKNLW